MPIPEPADNNCAKVPGTAVNTEEVKTVKLFQPFQQKQLTFHNRIGVSPMCMYSSENGFLNDFHVSHYGSFALKGAGAVIVEATAVEPRGRISPGDAGLWDDDHIAPLRRVVDVIKSQGAAAGMQIAHAGRKASISPPFNGDYLVSEADDGWPSDIVGASDDLPFASHYGVPHGLTKEEIKQTVKKFADAAIRADKAGLDFLEIHAAHGYLIHNFLSGNSNKRDDEYGGPFENRIRFCLEIVQAVRAVWPQSKPLWLRISCADYVNPDPVGEDPNGWDIHQSVELAKEVRKLGVDLMDCSSGGNVSGVRYPSQPMYQVQFADIIRREAQIATAAVGLIVEGEEAEKILEDGKADFILVAREFLRNSAFVLASAQALNLDINWPKQYSWAVKKARRRNTSKVDDVKSAPAKTGIVASGGETTTVMS